MKRPDMWFLWNGVDSRSMGIMLDGYPALTRPQERTEQVIVPGRQGALTFLEDEQPMYDTFVMTANCFLRHHADVGAVAAWLTGSGTVVMGNAPNRSYEARIINKIDYNLLLRHRKLASFAIPFQCQPFRSVYPASPYQVLTKDTETGIAKIYNPGDVAAKFLLKVSCNISDSSTAAGRTVTVTIPDKATASIVLPAESLSGFIIDTDAELVTDLDSSANFDNITTLSDTFSAFDLPPKKATSFTWSGDVSGVEIKPLWRWYL